jgi:N-acetyl-beta-hexosaminidase
MTDLNPPFTITVHDVFRSDPQKVSNDMALRSPRASVGRNENIVGFTQSSISNCGTTVLNLVYQAAAVFNGLEDHARETEARALSLCESSTKRLNVADQRIETAERERREILVEVDCKLQDASRALKQAQSRLDAAENQLTAVEFRAQAAEAEAREAKQALALIEEAIRRRLLCASPEALSG